MEALIADVPVDRAERTRRATRPLAARASARLASAGIEGTLVGVLPAARPRPRRNLFDERAAIAGLRFVGRIGGTAKSPIDRYSYPAQDTDVRAEDELHLPDGTGPTSERWRRLDRVGSLRWISRKRGAQADVHPSAVFAHSVVNSDVLADALLRLAEDVVEHGMTGGSGYKASRELLLSRPPRLRAGIFQAREGETAVEFATRIGPELDETILAIQGPPGAGKTFTGARMICELVRRGLRVGVSAVSHKVIRNLLDAVMNEATESGCSVSCAHKVTTKSEEPCQRRRTDGQRGRAGQAPRAAARRSRAGRRGCGRGPSFGAPSTCSSSTRPGRCRWRTCSPCRRRPGASSCSAILSSSNSLSRAATRRGPTFRRSSTFFRAIRPSRRIAASSSRRPGDWHRASAPSPRKCSTKDACTRARDWRTRSSRAARRSKAPACGWSALQHEGNQNSSIEEAEAVERIVALLLREGSRWIEQGRRLEADDAERHPGGGALQRPRRAPR